MSRFTKSIPNLLNGVSQQSPQIRRSSQAEIQENALSSIVNGLSKRPPTECVGKISSTKAENSYVHFIKRDNQEQYALLLGDGSISAIDLQGNSVHVEASSADLSYLSCSDPASQLRAVSIRDFTYLVNKTVKPSMSSTVPPANNPTAVVNFISARFNSRYEMTIDYKGDEYTVKIVNGDGTAPRHSRTVTLARLMLYGKLDLSVTDITTQTFKNGTMVRNGGGLDDSGFLPSGEFNFSNNGSTIVVECIEPNQDFTISTTDDFDNQAIKAFKDVVQTFSSLPEASIDTQLFEVNGTPEQIDQSYYVEYVVLGSKDADQNGYWKESVKGGIPVAFDASTMPHVLINRVDDASGTVTGTADAPYFELAQGDWADRTVGDDDSNPEPSFIGQAVEDIFEFRGRLGMITKFNVIFSESNEPSNFWRTTVTTSVDSDPIDTEVSGSRVVKLRWAQPWSSRLILFSDLSTYLMDVGEILTSQTVNFSPLGSLEITDKASPILLGDKIYFTSQVAGFTQIEEMYFPDEVIGVRTENVTKHVEKYIEGEARSLIASDQQDILVVVPESGHQIYLYQFAFNRKERVQAAWHKWTFQNGGDIINGTFFDKDLHLIVDRIDGSYLEKVSLDPQNVDTLDDGTIIPKVHLDSRVTGDKLTYSYNSGTDTTTITLPYNITDSGEHPTSIGQKLDGSWAFHFTSPNGSPMFSDDDIVDTTATTIEVNGEITADDIGFFGLKYGFRYRFSRPYPKQQGATGEGLLVTGGRLQVAEWTVVYDRTSYFEVKVYHEGYTEPFTYTFDISKDPVATANSATQDSDHFIVPVRGENHRIYVDVVSSDPSPLYIVAAAYSADFFPRTRRNS